MTSYRKKLDFGVLQCRIFCERKKIDTKFPTDSQITLYSLQHIKFEYIEMEIRSPECRKTANFVLSSSLLCLYLTKQVITIDRYL